MFNKSGSVGFGWIKLLVVLAGMGMMYVVLNQALTVHLVPAMNATANITLNSTNFQEFSTRAGMGLNYFHAFPLVLLGIFIIYIIIAALRSSARGTV